MFASKLIADSSRFHLDELLGLRKRHGLQPGTLCAQLTEPFKTVKY